MSEKPHALAPPEEPTPHLEDRLSPRGRHLLLLGVLCAVIIGFFIGIGERRSAVEEARSLYRAAGIHEAPEPGDASRPFAPHYAGTPPADASPNGDFRSRWPPAPPPPKRGAEAPPAEAETFDEIAWARALEARKGRRAYAGAPPRVPHAIDQMSAASCALCHENGLLLGDVIAPPMSHEYLPNCTQCHVEDTNRSVASAPWATDIDNRFAPLETFGPADRALEGAPPVIPHPTWMRTNCLSCHGRIGTTPLAVSHPWRDNCLQCHAPSARLDQHHFGVWSVPGDLGK